MKSVKNKLEQKIFKLGFFLEDAISYMESNILYKNENLPESVRVDLVNLIKTLREPNEFVKVEDFFKGGNSDSEMEDRETRRLAKINC